MPTPKLNVLLNGDRLQARILSQLTEMEVREYDDDASVVSLRFGLRQEAGGTFPIIDDGQFEPGARLGVEVEAPGGLPLRLFEGFVTHLRPHFEPIEANCYIEVLGVDASVLLAAQERASAYPDASESEAVVEILDRYQIPAVVDDTTMRFAADRHLLTQRGTDWEFIQRAARRNGYAFYLEFDAAREEVVGHFVRRATDGEPQADLTILRRGSNLQWIDIQVLFTGPVRHRGSALDPIAKRLVRSTDNGGDEALGGDHLADSIESGLRTVGVTEATAWLRDPIPTDSGIAAEGRAHTERDAFVVEAQGEVDPALYRGVLRARRPVLIKGVGAALSGVYFVNSVRTRLLEGQLSQHFVARRNALGQSGQETFGQSAEEVAAS